MSELHVLSTLSFSYRLSWLTCRILFISVSCLPDSQESGMDHVLFPAWKQMCKISENVKPSHHNILLVSGVQVVKRRVSRKYSLGSSADLVSPDVYTAHYQMLNKWGQTAALQPTWFESLLFRSGETKGSVSSECSSTPPPHWQKTPVCFLLAAPPPEWRQRHRSRQLSGQTQVSWLPFHQCVCQTTNVTVKRSTFSV